MLVGLVTRRTNSYRTYRFLALQFMGRELPYRLVVRGDNAPHFVARKLEQTTKKAIRRMSGTVA